MGGGHPGARPSRSRAGGRLRTRRGRIARLRAADQRTDHRDRSLEEDDRDGRTSESRARRGRQGRAEDGRAREGGLRGRAIRQGLRLQRRALLASAEGGAGDRPAASRPRWSVLSLLGRSPHAARPSSRPGGPAEREDPAGRVLREPSAGQGPAPGSRGLRDRAALGALLWPTGDADAQGYEEIEARAASAYEHWVGSEGLSFRGRDDAERLRDLVKFPWEGGAQG